MIDGIRAILVKTPEEDSTDNRLRRWSFYADYNQCSTCYKKYPKNVFRCADCKNRKLRTKPARKKSDGASRLQYMQLVQRVQ